MAGYGSCGHRVRHDFVIEHSTVLIEGSELHMVFSYDINSLNSCNSLMVEVGIIIIIITLVLQVRKLG